MKLIPILCIDLSIPIDDFVRFAQWISRSSAVMVENGVSYRIQQKKKTDLLLVSMDGTKIEEGQNRRDAKKSTCVDYLMQHMQTLVHAVNSFSLCPSFVSETRSTPKLTFTLPA